VSSHSKVFAAVDFRQACIGVEEGVKRSSVRRRVVEKGRGSLQRKKMDYPFKREAEP